MFVDVHVDADMRVVEKFKYGWFLFYRYFTLWEIPPASEYGGKPLRSFLAVPHAYTPSASRSCRRFSLVNCRRKHDVFRAVPLCLHHSAQRPFSTLFFSQCKFATSWNSHCGYLLAPTPISHVWQASWVIPFQRGLPLLHSVVGTVLQIFLTGDQSQVTL